jgi:hypothetical protein
MKNAAFWDVTPCGCCKNRRFGGTYRLNHQGNKNRRVRRLLFTAKVHSSPILVTLMMETIRSSATSVLERATRCHIQEAGILHSYRRENLKSCILKCFTSCIVEWNNGKG